MDIVVKYTFTVRKGGWEYPDFKRFESFGQALRWAMDMRASKQIQGFKLVYIRREKVQQVKYPFTQQTNFGRSEYRHEGSTDAELVGLRY